MSFRSFLLGLPLHSKTSPKTINLLTVSLFCASAIHDMFIPVFMTVSEIFELVCSSEDAPVYCVVQLCFMQLNFSYIYGQLVYCKL